MKEKHFIDAHKGITFIYILALIYFYNAYSNITIWVYLGLHGTYGVLWVLKSMIFLTNLGKEEPGYYMEL